MQSTRPMDTLENITLQLMRQIKESILTGEKEVARLNVYWIVFLLQQNVLQQEVSGKIVNALIEDFELIIHCVPGRENKDYLSNSFFRVLTKNMSEQRATILAIQGDYVDKVTKEAENGIEKSQDLEYIDAIEAFRLKVESYQEFSLASTQAAKNRTLKQQKKIDADEIKIKNKLLLNYTHLRAKYLLNELIGTRENQDYSQLKEVLLQILNLAYLLQKSSLYSDARNIFFKVINIFKKNLDRPCYRKLSEICLPALVDLNKVSAEKDQSSKVIVNEWLSTVEEMSRIRRSAHRKLKTIQNNFFHIAVSQEILNSFLDIKIEITNDIKKHIQNLFNSAERILGEPPCEYLLVVEGSTSRNEMTAHSDLEAFLVVENDENKEYFSALIELVNLQVLSLGESAVGKEGFHWDSELNPKVEGCLVAFDKLKKIYHWENIEFDKNEKGISVQTYLLPKAISICHRQPSGQRKELSLVKMVQAFQSCLLEDKTSRQEKARKFLLKHLAECAQNVASRCNIKMDLLAPLDYFLTDISLLTPDPILQNSHYDILQEAAKRGLFEPNFCRLAQRALLELNRQRLAMHLESNLANDSCDWSSLLAAVGQSIVMPLYNAIDETFITAVMEGKRPLLHPIINYIRDLDFKNKAIAAWHESMPVVANYMLLYAAANSSSLLEAEKILIQLYQQGYKDNGFGIAAMPRKWQLNFITFIEASPLWGLTGLDKENLLAALKQVPGKDGWRVAIAEEQKEWQQQLDALFVDASKGNPNGLKVVIPKRKGDHISLETKVFKPEITAQLFENRRLKKRPAGHPGRHEVLPIEMNGKTIAWVKISPEQPAIEAVISYKDRLIGGAGSRAGTPCNQIAKLILPTPQQLTTDANQESVITLNRNEKLIDKKSVDALLARIRANSEIHTIELLKSGMTSDVALKLFEVIKSKEKIKKLFLWNNRIGNLGAKALGKLFLEGCGLEELDINDNGIGDEGVLGFASGLKNNTSLYSLDCGYNKFSDHGVSILCEALLMHPALTILKLSCNGISKSGGFALLSLVEANKHILYVDLNENPGIPKEILERINAVTELRRHVAVQFVQHVEEKNLAECIEKFPARINQIESASFTRALLRVLLINPEDDKANDYFLLPVNRDQSAPKYKLVRIDNERAYYQPVLEGGSWIFKGKPKVQVKSIVYCLDQMAQPLNEEVLNEFLDLSPQEFFQGWLEELQVYERVYQKLFSRNEVKQCFAITDPGPTLLGVPMADGLIKELWERKASIQAVISLKKNEKMTGSDLMQRVQPILFKPYKDAFEAFPICLMDTCAQQASKLNKRFKMLTPQQYILSPVDPNNVQSALCGVPAISRSLRLAKDISQEDVEEIWLSKKYCATTAMVNLAKIKKVNLKQVKEHLLNGLYEGAEQFKQLVTSQQNIVLEDLGNIDLNEDQQRFILKAMAGTPFHWLNLKRFPDISDEFLISLIQGAGEHLISLNLSGCTKLKGGFFSQLREKAPYLERLYLDVIPLTKFNHNQWPSLKKLVVDNNAMLNTLEIQAPQLMHLSVANCQNLKCIKTGSLVLKYLNLSGCNSLEEAGIENICLIPAGVQEIIFPEAGTLPHIAFRKKYLFLFSLRLGDCSENFLEKIESALRRFTVYFGDPTPHQKQRILEAIHERLTGCEKIFVNMLPLINHSSLVVKIAAATVLLSAEGYKPKMVSAIFERLREDKDEKIREVADYSSELLGGGSMERFHEDINTATDKQIPELIEMLKGRSGKGKQFYGVKLLESWFAEQAFMVSLSFAERNTKRPDPIDERTPLLQLSMMFSKRREIQPLLLLAGEKEDMQQIDNKMISAKI